MSLLLFPYCSYSFLPKVRGVRKEGLRIANLARNGRTISEKVPGGAARAQACAACFVCVPGGRVLSGEQGSNALFECLVTMPDRGAGEQCGVCVPGDHVLTVERGSNALFVCFATMPVRGAARTQACAACFVCVPGDHALSVEQGSNAVFVCLGTMPDRGAGRQCGVCVPGNYA